MWVFYPEYTRQLVSNNLKYVQRLLKFHKVRRALERDPESKNYTDLSLTPVQDDEIEVLEIFNATESAHLDVEKEMHRRERASSKEEVKEEARSEEQKEAVVVAQGGTV